MTRFVLALAVVAGASAAANATVTCLLDQIGPNSSFQEGQAGRASQEFEPGNAAFHVAMIDNFNVGTAGQLTSVEAAVVGFNTGSNNLGLVQYWRVEVYSSPPAAAGNLTGDVASAIILPGNATITTPWTSSALSGLVSLDMTGSGINLTAGAYWLAVIPRLNFTGGGQIGIYDSTFAGDNNSVQVNPAGGFAFPGGQLARNTNSAYRICAVPAPASLGLLGLAGLAAARRRR